MLRAVAGAAPVLTVARVRPGISTSGALLGATVSAAAIEAPPLGAALGATAAGLAAARRQPKGWWGSAWLGAAGGVATLAVYPRIVSGPARAASVSEARHVTPSTDGAGLVVVANPSAGSDNGPDLLDDLRSALPAAELIICEDAAELAEQLSDAAARCRTLGICGGDGSVNLAARIALDAGVPLAVFPGGTLNHFARDLGVDSVETAIEAVRVGNVVAIDVGMAGERAFVNNASIGSYADLVDERERLEDRLGKWAAMVVALVRVLHRGRRFRVVLDGVEHCVWMVFVGNCSFEPAGFAPAERPDLVDGLLDIRLVDASSPFSRTRLVLAVLLGALGRSRVHDRRCVSGTSVECDEDPVRLAVDGETFDSPRRFVLAKRPAALLIHAPHERR